MKGSQRDSINWAFRHLTSNSNKVDGKKDQFLIYLISSSINYRLIHFICPNTLIFGRFQFKYLYFFFRYKLHQNLNIIHFTWILSCNVFLQLTLEPVGIIHIAYFSLELLNCSILLLKRWILTTCSGEQCNHFKAAQQSVLGSIQIMIDVLFYAVSWIN